jgi:hypothetical protein
MDAFSYLSVLTSIILGLGIQQVLQGYRALILSRKRVTFYPPPLIWSVLLLAMIAQHWWASFSLAGRAEWSFGIFATILVMTALIYMLAAIVLPDIPADEPIDLKDHYYREAPAFFWLAIGIVGWSLFREYMLEGRLPAPLNLLFHGIFASTALIAALTRRPRLHEGLAVLMALIFVTYIALLFTRLEM